MSNRIIVYIRISQDRNAHTEQQSLKLQNHLEQCRTYCRQKNYEIVREITVIASSRKTIKERKLDRLINDLQKNMIVVTTELSRLGRNAVENNKLFVQIEDKGANVEFVSSSQSMLNTSNKFSRLIREVFNIIAQAELESYSERVRAGQAFAKRVAASQGRPYRIPAKRLVTPKRLLFAEREDEIIYWIDMGLPLTRIAKNLDVKLSTFAKYYYLPETQKRFTAKRELADKLKSRRENTIIKR